MSSTIVVIVYAPPTAFLPSSIYLTAYSYSVIRGLQKGKTWVICHIFRRAGDKRLYSCAQTFIMSNMTGKLIICPTPIGNLGDMTLRTLDALREADFVCAEDTRVTGHLLTHFGIEKRLMRLDEASINERTIGYIVDHIAAGEQIAYCSDAGMPGVSDPGIRLLQAVREAGETVEVLPGASAAATAYVAAGFNNPQFFFAGFFPRKDGERRTALTALVNLDASLVFYESPRRLAEALKVVAEVFPYREVAVCRELTKRHEEVFRGTTAEVAEEFARRDAEEGIKGEIAFVIGPPTDSERESVEEAAADSAATRAAELMAEGTLTKKDIVKTLRTEFGISRNEAYEIVHSL